MGKYNSGCSISSIFFLGMFAFMFFGILIGLAKNCKGGHTSPQNTQTEIKNPYQGQIDKQAREDEKYNRCCYCHGKGTILSCPNSWGGPGFCEECNKDVDGEHPHVCKECNGTGRAQQGEKSKHISNTQRNSSPSLVRITCKKCQGKGYFDLKDGNEHIQFTCPECNGSGNMNLY